MAARKGISKGKDRKPAGASPGVPAASRPYLPGYGLAPESAGLLPWSWAEERLAAARRYWVSTVGPDGRPHAMPVWAVWLDDAICFSTGDRSRKARNLARDPRCVVTIEHAEEAVVVEGLASRIRSRALRDRMETAYLDKYGSGYPADSWLVAVRPRVAFGLSEREGEFVRSSTRWVFGGGWGDRA